MGRLRSAWEALTGGAPVTKAPGMDGLTSATGMVGWGSIMGATRMAPKRGTRELFQAYKDGPWVHSVLFPRSARVASVPWHLYVARRGKAGKAVRTPIGGVLERSIRRKLIQTERDSGNLEEVVSHPMLDMLAQPNPDLSGWACRAITEVWMSLKGEAFWVLERNGVGKGMPVQYRPFPPHWVMKVATPYDPFYRISAPGWGGEVRREDVIWFRYLDPTNPYGRGTGVGDALADEIDIDEFASKSLRAFFQNGARPDMLVSVKGAAKERLDEWQERFEQRHRGFWNNFRALFTGSDVDVKMLAASFKEMQLVQLRTFGRDAIGQTFGAPPELRGIIENSNRSTIDAATYIEVEHQIIPRLEFYRGELQQKLVPEYDDRLILEYEEPIPEDKDFKKGLIQVAPSAFTKDEVRALGGWPAIEDGSGSDFLSSAGQGAGDDGEPGSEDDGTKSPDEDAKDPSTEEEGGSPEDKGASRHRGDLKRRRRRSRRKEVAVVGVLEVTHALEALRPERLSDEMDPVWRERVQDWGEDALDALGVDASFDMLNPLVQSLLATSAKKVTGINDTTRDALRDTLMEGVGAGEGVDELAKRVRQYFGDAEASRALTIARTEVLSSANGANHAAWTMSGVVESKRWVHNSVSDPRESHLLLDGQEVGLGEDFETSDGYSAQYPGGFGVAEEDINCRCGMRPVVSEPDGKSMTDDERKSFFKSFEDAVAPWEKAAHAAVQRAFRKQAEDVVAALKR